MSARILAILKRKGGSGSSTLAANLGAELAARGRSVRILDADPQQTLAVWSKLGEGGALQQLVEPVDVQQGAAFRSVIERAAVDHERVLIDCAPGFDALAVQAAGMADGILIPVRPSPLDITAASDALEVATMAARGRAAWIGLVPSANLPRTRLGRELPETLADIGKEAGAVVLPSISHRVLIAEAAVSGQVAREAEPGGSAALEFAALADAVEAKL